MTKPPPPEVFAEAVAIIGRTGAGKTYAAKWAAESVLARGERICVIDPTSAWWGLKSSADGQGPAFPVAIMGGDHADVSITEASGPALADVIAGNNLPSIIDVSEMGMGARVRFMTGFLEQLYAKNRQPLTLVLDEADLFAPQRPMPDQTVLLNRLEQIVRRGRIRGFRPWLITQRPAELHKSVLSQASTLVAMRLTAPQDRDALGAWIDGQGDRDQGKAMLAALPKLQPGEGFVWCPAIDYLHRVRFPAITTFDSGKTPVAGEAAAEPTTLADVDITAVLAALEAKPEPKAKGGGFTQADLEAAAQAAEERGYARGLADGAAAVTERVRAALAGAPVQAEQHPAGRLEISRPMPKPQAVQAPTAAPRATEGGPGQRLLDAIAWWESAGIASPTRHQVAFVAGYTVNGHFNNLAGKLRGEGLVEYPGGGALALTAQGRAKASRPAGTASYRELVTRVTEVLRTEPQRRVFAALANNVRPMPRESLATVCGYTVNGHFNNVVGALSSLGVVEYPERGQVGLSSIFRGLPR